MQLKPVLAKQGVLWFRQGIGIFRRSPLIFLSLFFCWLFVVRLVTLAPAAGFAFMTLLVPGISVGFMTASKTVLEGKMATPAILIAGFRAGALVARRLFVLGVVHFVCVCAVFAFASLADGGTLAQSVLFGNLPTDPAGVESDNNSAVMLIMLGYIPVAMLFWFSPILVAWHDVPPQKALFFSFYTCWRNKFALILFGALWMCLSLTGAFAAMLLWLLSGVGAGGGLILVSLISGVLTAMLYASLYATYRGNFDVDGPPLPGSSAPPVPPRPKF